MIKYHDINFMFGVSSFVLVDRFRRRTNVQQLTCNIELSCFICYLFFSFVLLELKPFVLKGKVLGEKNMKSVKIVKKCENF